MEMECFLRLWDERDMTLDETDLLLLRYKKDWDKNHKSMTIGPCRLLVDATPSVHVDMTIHIIHISLRNVYRGKA